MFVLFPWIFFKEESLYISKKFLDIEDKKFGMYDRFRRNGFLLSSLYTTVESEISFSKANDFLKNVGYKKDYIAKLTNKFIKKGKAHYPNVQLGEDISIVLVLLESFFDPTDYGLVSCDVLPNIKRVFTKEMKGKLYVPVYGGGTAQTEFEILTGLNIPKNNIKDVVFTTYIKRQIPYFINLLKDKYGYRTISMELMPWWFFNKTSVFSWLGFRDIYNMDNYFKGIKEIKFGERINDKVLYQKAIMELKKSFKQNKKVFLYIATMGTHLPYNNVSLSFPCKGIKDDIKKDRNLLGYLELIHREDRDLAYFFKELKKLNKKVIVILFGDHKPFFAMDLLDVDNMTVEIEREKNRYSTPFYIWANFPINSLYEELSKNSVISSNYLLFFVIKIY